MFIKSLIVRYFGQRRPTLRQNLSHIESILLNPVGDAVGDAVAHGLHLRQLKQRYPNLRVGVFVTQRNRDVFQASGVVDELIETKPINYILQRKKWDLYIDFTTRFNSRTLILDKLLAPQRVMIFGKTPKKYYSLDNIHNYDFYHPLPPNTHFKDYLKHSAFSEYLIGQPELFYHLQLSEALKQQVERQWAPAKLRILLCPQGSYWKRRLPASECASMLQKIEPQFFSKLDIQLGYSAHNKEYLAELAKYPALPVIRDAHKTTVAQYLALVNSADLVLAVDSGTVHVACAFDKPLLAFYANFPSNIARWYPHAKTKEHTKMVIGRAIAVDSDATQDFDLDEVTAWLNRHITNLLKKQKMV